MQHMQISSITLVRTSRSEWLLLLRLLPLLLSILCKQRSPSAGHSGEQAYTAQHDRR
jgi:hypothetical protein